MVLPVAAVAGAGASAGKGATLASVASVATAIAPYAQIAGAGLSAIGAISSGQAARQQGDMQAAILRQQADRERQDSERREDEFRRQQSRLMATRRAMLGGTGVEAGEGTPLMVSEDLAGETEYQALKIRAGGANTANRLMQQAELERLKGRSDQKAGFGRAGALLLSGTGNAFGRNYATP